MEKVYKCPDCGCEKIVTGQLSGAQIVPSNKLFSKGTNIIAYLCKECGLILATKVEKPEVFR